MVAALKHPDLKSEIKEQDLVIFAVENIYLKVPTGFLVHKLQPVFDVKTKRFKVCENPVVFKVFVDDHFKYQDEDERHLHGEFESLEEAISACKNIVDQSLNNVLKNCSLEELKENYYMFGEDPFIEGGYFSASQYVEEKIQSLLDTNSSMKSGIDHWKHEIRYKYGLLLAESEMLEGEGFIHFCQTDRKKLCASWDIRNELWRVNVDRSALEGLSFSTPKRFEELVFSERNYFQQDHVEEGYRRKQYLIEYLLLGLDVGEIKTLTKKVDDGAKIEFSLEARTWNEILIGNPVGVEGGICKYSEKGSQKERVLPFALICERWAAKIEIVFDEYENYEQHNCSIKDFGGYYN